MPSAVIRYSFLLWWWVWNVEAFCLIFSHVMILIYQTFCNVFLFVRVWVMNVHVFSYCMHATPSSLLIFIPRIRRNNNKYSDYKSSLESWVDNLAFGLECGRWRLLLQLDTHRHPHHVTTFTTERRQKKVIEISFDWRPLKWMNTEDVVNAYIIMTSPWFY